jgi:hypothetical protein
MIEDAAVIDLLTGDNTLLDSLLVGVTIQGSFDAPSLELNFKARAGSEFSSITIIFKSILEFEILYDADRGFVDVWDFKFLKLKDGSFYIALDPDPETLPAAGVADVEASDTDHFFVRARHIEAEVTKAGEGPSGRA